MKKQFVTIISIVGLILCSIGGYFGYMSAKNALDSDYLALNKIINDLFQTKDIIQDGHAETLAGENTKNGYSLYSGGFTIYRLSKESGGFVKSKLSAASITWLKDKYEYDASYWNNIRATHRPEPEDAYQNAFKYLLSGTEKEPNLAFTRETFTEIKDFPGAFSAVYHNIIQAEHPTESYLKKNGSWEFSYDTYKLSYDETKEFYSIILDEEKAKALTIKFSLFGAGFAILATFILSLLIRFFIPYSGKGESIFNKKWRNIESNSIITIEPKLFGKNGVILIDNEKIKRGIAKITDNGESIHLSFSDSEIFFRLKNLTNQKLEMTNLATNSLAKFELLGSNAYSRDEQTKEENITTVNF